jgi:hypothetical protein
MVRLNQTSERRYDLHELTWLWRTAQLPHDALFQDEQGQWRPMGELIDPILARETKALAASAEPISKSNVSDRVLPSARMRLVVMALGLVLLATSLIVGLILRDRCLADRIPRC